jgi:hypothetical protein
LAIGACNEWVSCRGVELAISNKLDSCRGVKLAISINNELVGFLGIEITL